MYALKTIITRLSIVCSVAASGSAALAAPHLVPHAAIYEVRLGTAIGPEAPAGLSGTMVYVVEDACIGFNQTSALDVAILDRSGREAAIRQSFSSFEALNGEAATFDMQISSNGQIVDAYEGHVQANQDGGVMVYRRPDGVSDESGDKSYALKSDAQLSLAFTANVVESAIAGKPFLSQVVADGLLDDGPNRISAVIGRQSKIENNVSDPDGLLQGLPWPVQLAYYPTTSKDELPSQEMRVEIYQGGIVGKIEQNMGDYTVLTTLIDLQRAKGCSE